MTEQHLDFWSRRRAAVQAEEAAISAAEAEAVAAAEAEQLRIAQEARDDADILAEFDLTDPDDLVMGQDIAGFMKAAVPERLRLRAMRRLWRINPVLANLDQLVDHGEDYTNAATVVPGMKTTYQVGKGLLKHVEALAEQAARTAERFAPAAEAGEEAGIEMADAERVAPERANAEPAEGPAPVCAEPQAPDLAPPSVQSVAPAHMTQGEPLPVAKPFNKAAAEADLVPRPRRMRFAFDAPAPEEAR